MKYELAVTLYSLYLYFAKLWAKPQKAKPQKKFLLDFLNEIIYNIFENYLVKLIKEGGFLVNKIDSKFNFHRIHYEVLFMLVSIEGILNIEKPMRGISNLSTKHTRISRETKVTDRNGNDIVRITARYISRDAQREYSYSNLTGSIKPVSGSIKTKTLEVTFEENKQVELSELGKNGVIKNVILFTPQGKQVSNSTQMLEPISDQDKDEVCYKMREAARELTSRIPARIPWAKGENILNIIKIPHSRFEKLSHTIRRILHR